MLSSRLRHGPPYVQISGSGVPLESNPDLHIYALSPFVTYPLQIYICISIPLSPFLTAVISLFPLPTRQWNIHADVRANVNADKCSTLMILLERTRFSNLFQPNYQGSRVPASEVAARRGLATPPRMNCLAAALIGRGGRPS